MTRFNFFLLTFTWLIGIFYDIEIWAVKTGKGRTKVVDKGLRGLKFVSQIFPELRKYAYPLYLEQVWCFIALLVNGILLMSLSHVTLIAFIKGNVYSVKIFIQLASIQNSVVFSSSL